MVAVGEPVSWRGLVVALISVGLVVLGVRVRLAASFALGALATAVLALREIWPAAAFIPRWTLLFWSVGSCWDGDDLGGPGLERAHGEPVCSWSR